MTLKEILAYNIKNGQFFTMKTSTTKSKKGRTIIKEAIINARYGVDYSQLHQIQEREDTTVKESWFNHTEYDSIICSKKDADKLYVQVMNPKSSEVKYFENGVEITKQSLIDDGWFAPSELVQKEAPLTLTIALDNVKAISYKN